MDEATRPSSPPPAHAPEKVVRAKAFCETLFRKLEVAVEVEGRETPETIQLAIKRPEGAEGELGSVLLEAVQYLVNRVVNPTPEGRKWVNLEVGGFQEEGDPAVAAMAARLAATAVKMGKVLAVAPISPRERRQIHLALVGQDAVTTRSEGEGIFRQLLIIPGGAGSGRRG
jgi:spoIIIJ-associated protein